MALGSAAAAVVAGVASCTPPQATTFAKPMTHVQGQWPAVVIENDALDFPVAAAAAAWHIPVRYGTCATAGSAVCVRVRESATLPASNELGLTVDYSTATATYYADTQLLRSVRTATYPYRLELVCHELGHAYGLGHDDTGGCLRAGVDGLHSAPSGAEYALLAKEYGR